MCVKKKAYKYIIIISFDICMFHEDTDLRIQNSQVQVNTIIIIFLFNHVK